MRLQHGEARGVIDRRLEDQRARLRRDLDDRPHAVDGARVAVVRDRRWRPSIRNSAAGSTVQQVSPRPSGTTRICCLAASDMTPPLQRAEVPVQG